MMSLLVTLIVFSMLGLIVFQTFYVLGYLKFLSTGDNSGQIRVLSKDLDDEREQEETYSPPTAIILCLKGADESLADCLTGIISQDYPDFRLNIVINSQSDPAVSIVDDFFSNLKLKPKIHFLESPQETCSLKCSAIAMAVRSLSERIQVVALIDDDAVVDEYWLSDLVTPLKDSEIGATTGNRWYSPTDARFGTLVRKIWNSAAVVQMQRYDIAWGGSMAMRKDVIDRCQLLSRWEKSFCEDTSLSPVLKQNKLRLHRVPNLIVENKEASSFAGTFDWISRQLLTVRLHHPAWPMVFLHGIVTGIGAIVAPVLMVLLFWSGMTRDAWALLQAIVLYQVFNFVLLYLIGRSNRATVNGRNSYNRLESPPEMNVAMHFLATLLTQIVQPFALWQASSTEKVKWRGATYRVKDGRAIKFLKVDKQKMPSRGQVAKRSADRDQQSASLVSEDSFAPGSGFSKRSRN